MGTKTRDRFKIFDSGGTGDRYTIVDTTPDPTHGSRTYFSCNAAPYHPQGIGMHGEFSAAVWRSFRDARGRVNLRHLGRRVALETLPEDVQRAMQRFMAESEAA